MLLTLMLEIYLDPENILFFKKKYSSYLNKLPKDVIPINYRPKYINNRDRYGDYEIDLINSKQGSKTSLLTLVDCKIIWSCNKSCK